MFPNLQRYTNKRHLYIQAESDWPTTQKSLIRPRDALFDALPIANANWTPASPISSSSRIPER